MDRIKNENIKIKYFLKIQLSSLTSITFILTLTMIIQLEMIFIYYYWYIYSHIIIYIYKLCNKIDINLDLYYILF